MKKNELISMVEFVLDQELEYTSQTSGFDKIKQYANFLNTPLNLSMFVPCKKVGDKWEVLEELEMFDLYINPTHKVYEMSKKWLDKCEQYAKAKENVLFEGCNSAEFKDGLFYLKFSNDFSLVFQDSDTIEWLVDEDITLTENGMIKSGLK